MELALSGPGDCAKVDRGQSACARGAILSLRLRAICLSGGVHSQSVIHEVLGRTSSYTPTRPFSPIPLEKIRDAKKRIEEAAIRSPLVHLNVDSQPANIYLKLEDLQPVGSFKLRGAGNALALADKTRLEEGVWTASAGNMAQALAWYAARKGVPCTVVVPDHAPSVKLQGISRLGAEIVKVPFGQWVEVLTAHTLEGMTGTFIHPFSDESVMAGNGTIGIEIYEELPEVDAALSPMAVEV